MKDRPSAKDYKKKMNALIVDIEKLKQVVATRLYTLCCLHREAPIDIIVNDVIKAKSLIGSNQSKDYINSMNFETQIKFIDTIEKYVAQQHPHKQLTFDHMRLHAAQPVGVRVMIDGSTGNAYSRTEQDPICNCEGRDMSTYMEEGKRWCPQCGYEVQ